jgi:DNA-binding Lrp family transcriptional regulator
MDSGVLDEIDRGILHLLQQDARHLTPVDMAKRLPVTDGTVRNRIEAMEDQGIIEGYVPTINYEAAGFPLKIVFSATAPIPRRAELADKLLGLSGVVNVREMMTARENIRAVAIATKTDQITRLATTISEMDLQLEREELMRHETIQPFDHFDAEIAQE